MATKLDHEVADLKRRLDEALAERDQAEAQKAAMSEVLDIIKHALDTLPMYATRGVSRESECVEFTDPTSGRRFEIVVREIDDDDDGEGPTSDDADAMDDPEPGDPANGA